MHQQYKDILFKYLAILIVCFVLTPSAVKLSHAFSHSNHTHDICLGEKQTHLHALDFDCEFYKFKISNPLIVSLQEYIIVNIPSKQKNINTRRLEK